MTTFPCHLPEEIGHGEAYEHACLNYLFLAFHLSPLIQQNFAPAIDELREAARDIAFNRLAAVR